MTACLTGAMYIEEILAVHLVPCEGYIGKEFVFIHDNATRHTYCKNRERFHFGSRFSGY